MSCAAQEPVLEKVEAMKIIKKFGFSLFLVAMFSVGIAAILKTPVTTAKPSPYVAAADGTKSENGSIQMTSIALLHLRAYFTERGLDWKVLYEASDKYYCIIAWKPPSPESDPHLYHVECTDSLVASTAAIIGDYDLDKPGYHEIIVLGSSDGVETVEQ